jgi:hypothetical protein
VWRLTDIRRVFARSGPSPVTAADGVPENRYTVDVKPTVDKLTRNDSVYFTVRWSPMLPLDKHTVNWTIPSQAGLYEVYRNSDGRAMELVGRSRAYFGGLRNTLRGLIDTDSPYALNGELLDRTRDHWVRFALMDSSDDMDDILFFYAGRGEVQPEQSHSGRYRYVYVNEESVEEQPAQ